MRRERKKRQKMKQTGKHDKDPSRELPEGDRKRDGEEERGRRKSGRGVND